MSEYTSPEHPLYGVPDEALTAARSVMHAAVTWKDVDPEHAEPLADAVLAAATPALKEWLRPARTEADRRWFRDLLAIAIGFGLAFGGGYFLGMILTAVNLPAGFHGPVLMASMLGLYFYMRRSRP